MIILDYFKSIKNDDTDENGGVTSETPILNSVKNNVLPDISSLEVKTGITRYRKIFLAPEIQLPCLRIYLRHASTSQDQALINIGQYTDTQAEFDDYFSWKGAGTLNIELSAGLISTVVVDSDIAGYGFNPLDLIRLSDGTNESFLRIYSVSWNGYIATLTCAGNQNIGSDFGVGSHVSAVIEKGVCDVNAVVLKEIVPADIAYSRNNINRIRMLL